MKTVQTWVFRSSVVISIFELVLFALWITTVLPKFGDSTAITLMHGGLVLAVVGGITSLASMFTRTTSRIFSPAGALLVCVFAFAWLWISSWIGSM